MPKLPNLIILSQIENNFVGDIQNPRVGCKVYINCLGQDHIVHSWTTGLSATAPAIQVYNPA